MHHPYLTRILATKRSQIEQRRQQRSLSSLLSELPSRFKPRDFLMQLNRVVKQRGVACIAEIKRASPSRGVIRANINVREIAQSYAAAGAACLSVLTETDFFFGQDADLITARAACGLPILRKDFIVDEYQVVESAYIGADCILLILSALEAQQWRDYYQQAKALGLQVLLEVHTQEELIDALSVDPPMIGINNRDLMDFTTDIQTTLNMYETVPSSVRLISESGINSIKTMQKLLRVGVQAFLIGEQAMRETDFIATVNDLDRCIQMQV